MSLSHRIWTKRYEVIGREKQKLDIHFVHLFVKPPVNLLRIFIFQLFTWLHRVLIVAHGLSSCWAWAQA